MSENKEDLKKKKLDPMLYSLVNSDVASIPVIVQTVDGLKDVDRQAVEKLGGKIKDDLFIINAFSADLSSDAIARLVENSRVTRIFYDAQVSAV